MTATPPQGFSDRIKLWYHDPVGELVAHRLDNTDLCITDHRGLVIWISPADLKPALDLWTITQSRRGKTLRARLKQNAPEVLQDSEGENRIPTTT